MTIAVEKNLSITYKDLDLSAAKKRFFKSISRDSVKRLN